MLLPNLVSSYHCRQTGIIKILLTNIEIGKSDSSKILPDIFHSNIIEMDLKIKKAKLTKSGSVEATYIDQDGNEITIKGNHRAHEDLRNRLKELVPFFAELTEQKEADSIDWSNLNGEQNNELLKQISVSAVSKGGDDSSPFIVMSGKRILMTRKVLNINSPGVDLGDEALEHGEEFDMAVQAFIYEVEQYILERKYDKDGVLDFNDADTPGNTEDPFSAAEATVSIDAVAIPEEMPA